MMWLGCTYIALPPAALLYLFVPLDFPCRLYNPSYINIEKSSVHCLGLSLSNNAYIQETYNKGYSAFHIF
jgi:hypothetical protein